MGDLLVRNIPDTIRRDLIARAHESGRSLSDEAKHMISAGLAAEESKAAGSSGEDFVHDLLKVFADIPEAERKQFSDIMDEIEEERKKDFGRPFSFEE
jgi:plasmid stability protein